MANKFVEGDFRPKILAPRQITERHRDILTLAAQGLSGPEIAKQLGIGYATVRDHTIGALVNLSAANMTEAVLRAWMYDMIVVQADTTKIPLLTNQEKDAARALTTGNGEFSTPADVSSQLEISEATAKSRVTRAAGKIKKRGQ